MGQERAVLRGIEMGADMAGENDIATGARVAGEIAWRVSNPPAAISDLVTDGIRELIMPDDLKSGALANDTALYHLGMHQDDFQVLGIGFSYEDAGAFAAERVLPASFLIGDTRKVLDAAHIVSDHKDLIRGMAERGVPGFVHEIRINHWGEPVEVLAHVSLDGKSVPYIEHYDGDVPAGIRRSGPWLREETIAKAQGDLDQWAVQTGQMALDRLAEDTSFTDAERAIAMNTAITVAYQNMKGDAIGDLLRENGHELRISDASAPSPEQDATPDAPENLLPASYNTPAL